MAVFKNLNDPRSYMAALKEIEKAKSAGYSLEIKIGQTFYQTLSEIQKNVAPHIFMTGEYDSNGYPRFKPLGFLDTAEASSVIRNVADYANCIGFPLPEQDDELAKKYCQMDIDSNKGWV